MKDFGNKEKRMAKEILNGQTALIIMVSGKMTYRMVKEFLSRMEINIMDHGSKIKKMDQENWSWQIIMFMKVNSEMTECMEKELVLMIMGLTQVNIFKVKGMAMVNIYITMEIEVQVNFNMGKWKDRVHFIIMAGMFIQAIGKMVSSMDKAKSQIKMRTLLKKESMLMGISTIKTYLLIESTCICIY